MRAELLTKPHGNTGDVSVIALSGAWQSRRLISPPRRPSELRLLGGLLTAPTDAGAANMTQRAPGAELLLSTVQLLFFSFTLLPAQTPTSALWREIEGRSTDALNPGNFRLSGEIYFFPSESQLLGQAPAPKELMV